MTCTQQMINDLESMLERVSRELKQIKPESLKSKRHLLYNTLKRIEEEFDKEGDK